MKYNEIMAAIQQLKDIAGDLQCQIAALEELVVNENHQEETPDETPVVNEVSNEVANVPIIEKEVEELPAPPAEVHVDIEVLKPSKAKEVDPEAMLGCQIITSLPDFYKGTCSVLRLHKLYFDNGQPKLYINKYKVVIIALDSKMQEIGRMITHWNNLSKFHAELAKRGINTHTGSNWMPKIINLDLD
jgi:hypothetical protein